MASLIGEEADVSGKLFPPLLEPGLGPPPPDDWPGLAWQGMCEESPAPSSQPHKTGRRNEWQRGEQGGGLSGHRKAPG